MPPRRLPAHQEADLLDLAATRRAHGTPHDAIAQELHQRAGIPLLWAHRLARGWRTRQQAVDAYREVCARRGLLYGPRGELACKVDTGSFLRWETGKVIPDWPALDILCELYGTRPDRLGFGRDYSKMDELAAGGEEASAMDRRQAGKLGLAVTGAALTQAASRPAPANATEATAEPPGEEGALALLRAAEASDLGPSTIDELLNEVQRLAVAAQTTPPQAMLASLRPALARLPGLLRLRMPLGQRRDLLTIAAALLYRSACARFDTGQHHGAVTDARVATRLAEQAGNTELAALALQCQAWIAVPLGRHAEAAELAARGLALAPTRSIAAVHLHGQAARAQAYLGNQESATTALHQAEDAFASLAPAPALLGVTPVMLDASQLDGYASQVYLLAGEPAKAAQAAQRALDAWAPEHGRCPWPSAWSATSMTLALAHAGKPDEACHVALRALQAGIPESGALVRARRLVGVVAAQHPALPQLRDLREALHAAPGGALSAW